MTALNALKRHQASVKRTMRGMAIPGEFVRIARADPASPAAAVISAVNCVTMFAVVISSAITGVALALFWWLA